MTGDGVRNATSLTFNFVDGWFQYLLMPRRPTADATWIICYGCDTSKFEGKYGVRWHDSDGISIGRLG